MTSYKVVLMFVFFFRERVDERRKHKQINKRFWVKWEQMLTCGPFSRPFLSPVSLSVICICHPRQQQQTIDQLIAHHDSSIPKSQNVMQFLCLI
jgi:hypothetical protein